MRFILTDKETEEQKEVFLLETEGGRWWITRGSDGAVTKVCRPSEIGGGRYTLAIDSINEQQALRKDFMQARKERGFKMTRSAEFGLRKATLYEYERKERIPRIDFFIEMSKVIGMKIVIEDGKCMAMPTKNGL